MLMNLLSHFRFLGGPGLINADWLHRGSSKVVQGDDAAPRLVESLSKSIGDVICALVFLQMPISLRSRGVATKVFDAERRSEKKTYGFYLYDN